MNALLCWLAVARDAPARAQYTAQAGDPRAIPAKLLLWAVTLHDYTRFQESSRRAFAWYTGVGAAIVASAPLLVRAVTGQFESGKSARGAARWIGPIRLHALS